MYATKIGKYDRDFIAAIAHLSAEKPAEVAKEAFGLEAKNMRLHEKQWQEKWDAARNPFEALAQHKKDKRQRLSVLYPYLAARDWLDAVKPKREEAA